MFTVTLSKENHKNLATGAKVRINGEERTITRKENFIVWTDHEGKEQQREIIDEFEEDGVVTFIGA